MTAGAATPTVRVAAIDCGTNSIRLLVADATRNVTHNERGEPDGVVEVDRRMEIVRLGQDVDATGMLADAALERTFAACRRYATVIADLGATRVRFVATSATRDAGNRDAFVAGVRAALGIEPQVVSGNEEARLAFSGATRGLRPGGHPEPYAVIDIGGGSTEFVLGKSSGELSASCSVDLGAVRLHERHFTRNDPPHPESVAAAREEAKRGVAEALARVPLADARTPVGVAGTVTTVAAAVLGLDSYDRDAIHLARLSADAIHEVTAELLFESTAQRAVRPYMHAGRADVVAAGAVILSTIVEECGWPELVVSEQDILDGIAWDLAAGA